MNLEHLELFTKAMREKLALREAEKGGRIVWLTMPFEDLTSDCLDECLELIFELDDVYDCDSYDRIMDEAVDIANYAMMVFDKALAEKILLKLHIEKSAND